MCKRGYNSYASGKAESHIQEPHLEITNCVVGQCRLSSCRLLGTFCLRNLPINKTLGFETWSAVTFARASVGSRHLYRLWAASAIVKNVEVGGKGRGASRIGELHCVCTGGVLS